MPTDSVWAIHYDHGHPRRYQLSDLNQQEDRPYKGDIDYRIRLDASGTRWSVASLKTRKEKWLELSKPYAIDTDNFIVVYRFPEQDAEAFRKVRELAKKKGRKKTSGASP